MPPTAGVGKPVRHSQCVYKITNMHTTVYCTQQEMHSCSKTFLQRNPEQTTTALTHKQSDEHIYTAQLQVSSQSLTKQTSFKS